MHVVDSFLPPLTQALSQGVLENVAVSSSLIFLPEPLLRLMQSDRPCLLPGAIDGVHAMRTVGSRVHTSWHGPCSCKHTRSAAHTHAGAYYHRATIVGILVLTVRAGTSAELYNHGACREQVGMAPLVNVQLGSSGDHAHARSASGIVCIFCKPAHARRMHLHATMRLQSATRNAEATAAVHACLLGHAGGACANWLTVSSCAFRVEDLIHNAPLCAGASSGMKHEHPLRTSRTWAFGLRHGSMASALCITGAAPALGFACRFMLWTQHERPVSCGQAHAERMACHRH